MTELKYCVVDENGVVRSKVQSLQVPDISLGQCLIDGLDSDLSRLVLIDQPSGRTWNAAQTKEAELKIATALVKLDLGSGKFVCAYLPNNDLHALWQCGVYMAASVYVGCHNSSSQRELLHEVEVTKSEAILCSIDNLQLVAKVADDVQSVKCVIVVDNDSISPKNATEGGKPIHSSYELLKLAPEEVLKAPVPISGDPKTTPAAIIFTSGSTGMPKGAIRSHTNTIAPLCGEKGRA
ncbi:4-coumarate--CoA ligase-like 9 [Halotydeus destructor]|nr:4-coumarate--CoA ligase-like 9 [Halotydeus destructor]